jgi:hypothetical protein
MVIVKYQVDEDSILDRAKFYSRIYQLEKKPVWPGGATWWHYDFRPWDLEEDVYTKRVEELPEFPPFEYHIDQACHPLYYLDPHVRCRECLTNYACNFSDMTCELCVSIKPWAAKILRGRP